MDFDKDSKSRIFLLWQESKSRVVFLFLSGEGGGGRAVQGEVLVGEWEQLFTNERHLINLIYIALHFYEYIVFLKYY